MHLARIWQPNAPAIWDRGAPRRHVQPLQQPHLDSSVPSLLPPKAPGAPARPCSTSAVRTIATLQRVFCTTSFLRASWVVGFILHATSIISSSEHAVPSLPRSL